MPEIVLLGAVVLLAVALVARSAVAASRGRALREVREALGAATEVDTVTAARAAAEARAAAQRETRQRARDLVDLIDLIGVGVVRFDEGLRVELANQAAHAFLARPSGGLEGRSVMEAFADHEVEALVATARDRGAASGEMTQPGHEGVTLVLRARRSPVEGVWVVLEDVTELRRLQRIRTEFVDNLSHELRTPLTSVRLLTETLARDLEDAVVSDRVRDRVAKIDIETGHLVQMVNELLDLSRIEGGAQLYLDVVDCGDVIRGSVDRLRLFADRQSVQLLTVVPADLPLVNGDAERLGQVFVNLLHNAVKFSPAGGTVTVRASDCDGEVDIAVEDQGPGIARSDQPRIFERFYKVDRARSRGAGGTGLGLAIARHVVEGHGGRIWVESEPGAGATFHVRLPVREPVPAPAGESARP
jgi:two-component system phosphate regulon sensor histidine kinase PhoR